MESSAAVAKFIAPNNGRIVADNGTKCSTYQAGQVVTLHKDLWRPALAAGLIPEQPLVGTPEVAVIPTKSKQDIISEGLIEACKTLIVRANPADFTQMGKPRTASVKKLVDFDFKANDVERAFGQAMFEVEQSGDDSQEHSEPSSSTAE